MATVARLKIGPQYDGRPLAYRDYLEAEYEPGFRYELIDGKLQVAALPRLPHGWLENWLAELLRSYARERPKIINFVYNKVRVFVPNRPAGTTCPEPDIAAYCDFPSYSPGDDLDWDVLSPVLVVEILSPDNADKDLVRNVELYWQVPAIREYWIVDGLEDPSRPSLRVHRRLGKKWRVIDVAFGATYTTRLLPGFELVVDPSR
jgi:Uma2 family endonuclease